MNRKTNVCSIFLLGIFFAACGGGSSSDNSPSVKVWGTPELVETYNGGEAKSPYVAFDNSGNAVAVWQQLISTRYYICANMYFKDTGWAEPEQIESFDNEGAARTPQVAFDNSGNGMAVWYQLSDDGTQNNVWANRYSASGGWMIPEPIEILDNTGAGNYDPQVLFDSSGNAIAVWKQYDGSYESIYANSYEPGTGWGNAELIETGNNGDATNVRIAINSEGTIIAVWYQKDGGRNDVWANIYSPGTGWGTAELLENNTVNPAVGAAIAVAGNDSFFVVWQQSDGTVYSLWSRHYVPGSGWSTAELVENNDTNDALFPGIAADTDGNAIVVWRQHDGAHYSLWANRYAAGTGWGTAGLIETDDSGDVENRCIVMDTNGNAIVVWGQEYAVMQYNLMACRYVPGAGWSSPESIEDGSESVESLHMAIDKDGNAIVVWEQSDGTRSNIWSNRYE